MALITQDLNNVASFTSGTIEWNADNRILTDTDALGTGFDPGDGGTRTYDRILFVVSRMNQALNTNAGGAAIVMNACTFTETTGNSALLSDELGGVGQYGNRTAWILTDCLWTQSTTTGNTVGFGITAQRAAGGDRVTFQLLRHRFRAFGQKVYFINLGGVGDATVGGITYSYSAAEVAFDNGAIHTDVDGTTFNDFEFSGGTRVLGAGGSNERSYVIRMIGRTDGGRPTTNFMANTTINDAGQFNNTEGTLGGTMVQSTSTWANTDYLYMINDRFGTNLSVAREASGLISYAECYMFKPEFQNALGVNATDVITYGFPQAPQSLELLGTLTDASRSGRILSGGSIAPGAAVSADVAATHIVPSATGDAYLIVVDRKIGSTILSSTGAIVGTRETAFMTRALDPLTGLLANPGVDTINIKSYFRNIQDGSGDPLVQIPLELTTFTSLDDVITIAPRVYDAPDDAFVSPLSIPINLLGAQTVETTSGDDLYDVVKGIWYIDPNSSQDPWLPTVVDGVFTFGPNQQVSTGPIVDNGYEPTEISIRLADGAQIVNGDDITGIRASGNISLAEFGYTTVQAEGELIEYPALLRNRILAGGGSFNADNDFENVVWTDFAPGTPATIVFFAGNYSFDASCDFTGVDSMESLGTDQPIITMLGGADPATVFGAANFASLSVNSIFTTTVNITGYVSGDNMSIDLYDLTGTSRAFLTTLTSGDTITSLTTGLEGLGGAVTRLGAFVRSDNYSPQIIALDLEAGATETIVIANTTDALRGTATPDGVINSVVRRTGVGLAVLTTGFPLSVAPQASNLANNARNTLEHSQEAMAVWATGQIYADNTQRLLFNTSGFLECSADFRIGPNNGSGSQEYAVIGYGGAERSDPVSGNYTRFTVTDATQTPPAVAEVVGSLFSLATVDYTRFGAEVENGVNRAVGTQIDAIEQDTDEMRSERLLGLKPQTPQT